MPHDDPDDADDCEPPARPTEEADIDPKTHRRLLRYLNDARGPGDLTTLPEQWQTPPDRHEIRGHLDRHEPPDGEEEDGEDFLDDEEARRLLEFRDLQFPVTGFTHVDDLEGALDRNRIERIRERLLDWLSNRRYGRWTDLGEISDGNGNHFFPVHASVMHTGEVLFFDHACHTGVGDTPVWDPSDRSPVRVTLPGKPSNNVYCSGHTFLTDGRLLVIGGGGDLNTYGANNRQDRALLFDPNTATWDTVDDAAGNPVSLDHDRWYPTLVRLGEEPGRVLVASGDPSGYQPMLVFEESGETFQPLTVNGTTTKNFDPTYPGLHLLPGGDVFFTPVGFEDNSESPGAVPGNDESGYFEFDTTGNAGQWHDVGPADRTKGMATILLSQSYPQAQVIVVGGGDAATSRTYRRINLSTPSPTWQPAQPLPTHSGQTQPTQRIHPNVVSLPDGTLFLCGGADASEPCWLYDPDTDSWSEMDELHYQRRYHSVAFLLPSGEVAATGGERSGGKHRLEVFEPPYLFSGSRPTIDETATPDQVHHGNTFTIGTPDAGDVDRATLVSPMSVTHQTDTNQRVIELSVTQTGGNTLTATAPDPWHPHGLAPRGWYMLFLLDDGVPSTGHFLHLH